MEQGISWKQARWTANKGVDFKPTFSCVSTVFFLSSCDLKNHMVKHVALCGLQSLITHRSVVNVPSKRSLSGWTAEQLTAALTADWKISVRNDDAWHSASGASGGSLFLEGLIILCAAGCPQPTQHTLTVIHRNLLWVKVRHGSVWIRLKSILWPGDKVKSVSKTEFFFSNT